MTLTPDGVAARAALDLKDGEYVNLGIGMPTLIANHLTPARGIVVHSENGVLGVGPYPTLEELDPDLVNAGKETVTVCPGAAYFDSSLSFAMIRGGHIDTAVLGGLQVSQRGDLANWRADGEMIKGIGGAMDLVVGARRVFVLMRHVDRFGRSKVVESCSLSLTGQRVVTRLFTDFAVFDICDGVLVLRETVPGVTVPEVDAVTDASFEVELWGTVVGRALSTEVLKSERQPVIVKEKAL